MFLFSLVRSNCRNRTRHKNLLKVLNKKYAFRELFSFNNFIYKEKCGYLQTETLSINIFLIKFKKWKIYFGPLVLAALKRPTEVLLRRCKT